MADSFNNTSLDSVKLLSLPNIDSPNRSRITTSNTDITIIQGEGFRKSREERRRIKEEARLKAEGGREDLGMEQFTFTDEQKFKSMMGLGGALDPWSYREDFCGSCGIQHPNPNLLDNYPYCYCCFNTLREPYVLRKRYKGVAYYAPLDILYATYGDPLMADLAGFYYYHFYYYHY